MISGVIYKLIGEAVQKLTPRQNLFLEKGSGNNSVVVKTTSNINPMKTIDGMRFGVVAIVVNGFGIKEAFDLCDEMIITVKDCHETVRYSDRDYMIKNVSVRMHPVIDESTRTESTQSIMFTLGVNYIV